MASDNDSVIMKVRDIIAGKETPEHTREMTKLKSVREQIDELNRKLKGETPDKGEKSKV